MQVRRSTRCFRTYHLSSIQLWQSSQRYARKKMLDWRPVIRIYKCSVKRGNSVSPKRWSVFRCFFEEPLTGQGTGFRGQDTVEVKPRCRVLLPYGTRFAYNAFFYRHDVPNGTRSQTTRFRSGEIRGRKSEVGGRGSVYGTEHWCLASEGSRRSECNVLGSEHHTECDGYLG